MTTPRNGRIARPQRARRRAGAARARALALLLLLLAPIGLDAASANGEGAACGEIRVSNLRSTPSTATPGGEGIALGFTLSRVPSEERYLRTMTVELAAGSTLPADKIVSAALYADAETAPFATATPAADGTATFEGMRRLLPRDHQGGVALSVAIGVASDAPDGALATLRVPAAGFVIEKRGQDEICFPEPVTSGGSLRVDVVATRLQLAAPTGATAGTPFGLTVLALDDAGRRDLDYAESIALTTTSGASPSGANPTLPTLAFSSGAASGNATLVRAGSATLTATAGSLPAATASLDVAPGAVAAVSVSPSAVTLAPSAGQRFGASVADAYGNPVEPAPSWSATCGSFGAEGHYTAPPAGGTCTVTATQGGASGQATVTIEAEPTPTLEVEPSTATLAAGAQRTFVARGADDVAWSATCGDITDAGLYTAPKVVGTCVVRATADGLVATADVTVVAGPLASIAISGPTRLAANESAIYTLAGADAHNNSVALESTTLRFTAPTTPGSAVVRYTESGVTGQLAVDVTAGPLARIVVTGDTSVPVNTTRRYAVAGSDAYGNAVALRVASIDWTAPTATGPALVTYTEEGVTGELVVTVVAGPLARIVVGGEDTIPAGATRDFPLSGFDAYGNSVALAQASVRFTAPTTTGPARVGYNESGVEGTRDVTVVAAALARIDVAGDDEIVANTTKTYQLSGFDAYGNPVTLARATLPFTAPTRAGDASVVYTEADVTGTKPVRVLPGPLARIVVTGPASVVANTSATFALSGYDAYGNGVPLAASTLAWRAPTAAGPAEVSHTEQGVTGTLPVAVTAAALARIEIAGADSPAAGTTTVYALSGFDAYGNDVTLAQSSLAWTAPTVAGAANVTYTQDGVTGRRAVTVVAGPLARITLTGPTDIVVDTTHTYALAGFDAYANPVPLEVASIAWRAPTTAGATNVTYAEGGVTGRLEVILRAAALARIVVSGDDTIVANTTKTYALAGFDAYGNAVPLTQSSLSFRAPTTAGTALVSHTQSGVTGTKSVNVTASGLQRIVVSGPSSIVANTTRSYALAGFDAYGNPMPLAQTALAFTAPTRAGLANVTYAEQGVTGNLVVRVEPAALARIAMEGPTRVVAATQVSYALAGYDAYDNPVPLATASLAWRAPDVAGPARVTYAERGVEGALDVEVEPRPLSRIDITGPATLVANTTGTYALAGFDALGNSVPLAQETLVHRASTRAGSDAVVHVEGGVEGRLPITVLAGPLALIRLDGPDRVPAGERAVFNATGFDEFGNPAPLELALVEWRAPTTAGLARVERSESGVTGRTDILVIPAALARIDVAGPATLVAGSPADYALAGFDAYSNRVDLARAAIAYVAPSRTGPAEIVYSEAGVVGRLAIDVVAGPLARILVTGPPTLLVGATRDYALAGADALGNPVALAATSLAFTAPTRSGAARVSYTEAGVTGALDVTVLAGALDRILVTGPARLAAGSTASYGVRGEDRFGNAVPLQVALVPFRAPTLVGAANVTYAERGVVGSLPVAIDPAPLARIDLAGSGPLVAGQTKTYALSGRDAFGNSVALNATTYEHRARAFVGPEDVCYGERGVLGCVRETVVAGPLARILVTGADRLAVTATGTYGLVGFDRFGNSVPLARASLAYVAPTVAGAARVEYVEAGVTGAKDIVILPAPLQRIVVSGEDVLPAGATRLYRVAGFDAFGNYVPLARETVEYRAPARLGPATVSYNEGGVVGTKAVRVVADAMARIEVGGPTQVRAGSTNTFPVHGVDAAGSTFALSVDAITRTAPAAVGMTSVCHEEGGLSGCLSVEVVAGPLARIIVAGPERMVVGTFATFDLTGIDAHGNPVRLARRWLDFTAPTSAGVVEVCSTQQSVRGCKDVEVLASGPARLVILNGEVQQNADAPAAVVYRAAVYDSNGNRIAVDDAADIAWTLAPATGGAFAGNVLTPGRAAGLYTVTATLRGYEGVTAVAPMRMLPGSLSSIEIDPPAPRVAVGDGVGFRANAYDAYGNRLATPRLTWFVDRGDVGSVNETRGAFTATAPGVVLVSAVDEVRGILTSARVDVVARATLVRSVEIVPHALTLASGTTQQFTVTAYDADGLVVSGPTPVFSVRDPAVGEIAPSGLFTGNLTGETVVVARVGEHEAQARVRVVPGRLAHIQVHPDSAAASEGGQVSFAARALDARRNLVPDARVTWSVSPPDAGTVSEDGVYTAGTHRGTVIVTARSGVVTREIPVYQWTQQRAAAHEVVELSAPPMRATAAESTTTGWAAGLAHAERDSTTVIRPQETGTPSAGATVREAAVQLDRAARDLTILVEVQEGNARMVPEEVDADGLAQMLEQETAPPEPGLFLTVQASEGGTRLPSTQLNELVRRMNVTFHVPASYFLEHRLDPTKVRLVEWSEQRLVNENVTARLADTTPVGGMYTYTSELTQFSSFAFLADPLPLARQCRRADFLPPVAPAGSATLPLAQGTPFDRPAVGVADLSGPASIVAGEPISGTVDTANSWTGDVNVNITVRLVHSGSRAIWLEERLPPASVTAGGATRASYTFTLTCLPAESFELQAFVESTDRPDAPVISGVVTRPLVVTDAPGAPPLDALLPSPTPTPTPTPAPTPAPASAPAPLGPPATAPPPTDALPVVSAGVLLSSRGYTADLRALFERADVQEARVLWTFEDGTVLEGVEVSHRFAGPPGTRQVHVSAEHRGLRYSTTLQLTVPFPNAAPQPAFTCAGSSACALEDPLVRFVDRTYDADAADTLTYAWDFGDGSASREREPTHAFAGPGDYDVRLTVSDGEEERTAARTVTVLPAPLRPRIVALQAPTLVVAGSALVAQATLLAPAAGDLEVRMALVSSQGATVLEALALPEAAPDVRSARWDALRLPTGAYTLHARLLRGDALLDEATAPVRVGAGEVSVEAVDVVVDEDGRVTGTLRVVNDRDERTVVSPRVRVLDEEGRLVLVPLPDMELGAGEAADVPFSTRILPGRYTLAPEGDLSDGSRALGEPVPLESSSFPPLPPRERFPYPILLAVLVALAAAAYWLRAILPAARDRALLAVDLRPALRADRPLTREDLVHLRRMLADGRRVTRALAYLPAQAGEQAQGLREAAVAAGFEVTLPREEHAQALATWRAHVEAELTQEGKQVTLLILAAHDEQFTALAKAARDLRLRVEVASLAGKLPFHLGMAADVAREIVPFRR